MTSSPPRISVVMSAYNTAPYLRACVESVLAQTYTDFEFIIVDDGSSDDTWSILTIYAQQDARIMLLRNQPNAGVVNALNKGLQQARGVLIARQDADDLSHPQRLQQQVAYLDAHPTCGMVAAVPALIDPAGAPLNGDGWDAVGNADIQRKLLDYMCLCGPTVMLRRECFEAAGYYFTVGSDASEDYDLCLRVAEVTELESLSGGLYLYRQHPNSASTRRAHMQMCNKAIALQRALARRYGPSAPTQHVATVGRDYLQAALIAFVGNDVIEARHSLGDALSVHPALLEQDQPAERLVRAYTPQPVDAALRYTVAVFAELLPRTRRLARMKARLLSDLHMQEVFAGVSQNQPARVQAHLWPGLRYNPGWLGNRGVVALSVKSLLKRNS
jgi:glycosyltransferase involved in cell wall biosynthesis